MNYRVKSRDYQRAYEKWNRLLIEGKADEITIVPGGKSEVLLSLQVKDKPIGTGRQILAAALKLPHLKGSLDFNDEVRI